VTQTKIVRPDLRKPGEYHVLFSESVLTLVEEGVLAKAGQLQSALIAHDGCDMLRETGCKVRESWLVNTYGSVKEAEASGAKLFDCSEDLFFLHKSLAQLMDFIMQSRHMRNNPQSRGLHELEEVEAKFLAIKGEVAHRNSQRDIQTGQMAKLTPEKLAELDAQFSNETKDKTLLGLSESERLQTTTPKAKTK
jgi:hypothetical protein